MDIKFSKDSAGSQPEAAETKGKQSVLLVVLLVLAGVFAYIYFFTGLIKPLSEQKVAEAPVAASQVAKKPLPSPDGTPAKTEAAAPAVSKDAAPAAKPVPAPPAAAAEPAPVAAAKPAVQVAAKAQDELKREEALPAVKKPLPIAGKAGAKKPAPVEKKQPVVAEKKEPVVAEKKQPVVAEKKQPVVAEKKQPVVAEKKPMATKEPEKKAADLKKPVEKKAAVAASVPKAMKPAQKPEKKEAPAATGNVTGSGPWTVLVGNYVLEEAMATDLARVRKAGLEAYVVPGAQKKTHMNRLLLAEFTDRDSAQAELAKLKRSTSDAFMIDSDGMHAVYAGSYLLDSRAGSEKERLAASGFRLTVKRVDVSMPTKNLTAGSFAEKNAAEAALNKLRAAGVKAQISRQ